MESTILSDLSQVKNEWAKIKFHWLEKREKSVALAYICRHLTNLWIHQPEIAKWDARKWSCNQLRWWLLEPKTILSWAAPSILTSSTILPTTHQLWACFTSKTLNTHWYQENPCQIIGLVKIQIPRKRSHGPMPKINNQKSLHKNLTWINLRNRSQSR